MFQNRRLTGNETGPALFLPGGGSGIGQEGNIRITWIEEGKPVSCFAHYQQNTTSEKIAQSIILNGLRCQIQ